MADPVAEYPPVEGDVAAWAADYIAQQRLRMQAERGGRKSRPSRSEVTRAVQARFGSGSRVGGALTWMRILYWVCYILLML